MPKIVRCSIAIITVLFASSCYNPDSHPLGNNLALWEGDTIEDRIIVYCEGRCFGGIYVVPTYEGHYDSNGHYAEYVEKARSDDEWVIVQTLRIKEKQHSYYIIRKDFDIVDVDCSAVSCDSILQKQVTGPLTLNEFQAQRQARSMKLDL